MQAADAPYQPTSPLQLQIRNHHQMELPGGATPPAPLFVSSFALDLDTCSVSPTDDCIERTEFQIHCDCNVNICHASFHTVPGRHSTQCHTAPAIALPSFYSHHSTSFVLQSFYVVLQSFYLHSTITLPPPSFYPSSFFFHITDYHNFTITSWMQRSSCYDGFTPYGLHTSCRHRPCSSCYEGLTSQVPLHCLGNHHLRRSTFAWHIRGT
jgi:hypothetical protein